MLKQNSCIESVPFPVAKAPAKLNLSLAVWKKRADGYHEIISIFESVGLYDIISLGVFSSNGTIIDVRSSVPGLPEGRRNIAGRAAEYFFDKTGLKYGVRIHIEKNIPVGAGLGGGSADAACVLRLLQEKFHNPLTDKQLSAIAAGVGADVPFCLCPGRAIVSGIGERIKPIESRRRFWFLLVYPGVPASTERVYRAIDVMASRGEKNKVHELAKVLSEGKRGSIEKYMLNTLLPSALKICPEIKSVFEKLENEGMTGHLSGSGSTVFSMLPPKVTRNRDTRASFLKKMSRVFPEKKYRIFVVRSIL